MSTNKDLITGLCSGTLVSTYRFTSNGQQADWKDPVDGSTLGEQTVSSKDSINHWWETKCKGKLKFMKGKKMNTATNNLWPGIH